MSQQFNLEVHYLLRGESRVDYHNCVEATTKTKAKSKALAHYGRNSVHKVKIIS